MRAALEQAQLAMENGEVPVGCVFVKENQILARAYNATNRTKNATQHCELVAIAEAGETLEGSDLYVTCEPCIMCAEALKLVGVQRVFFGCYNERFGGTGSILALHKG